MEMLISPQQKMKAIILNNRIQLISYESKKIKISLIVPALNLQKMKELTGCTICGKKEIEVNFNHYAGKLFNVTLLVRFDKIENYLQRNNISECENKSEYLNLLNTPQFYLGYFETNLLTDKVALYAFGDCRQFSKPNFNTIYKNKAGHKISLCHSIQNNFGQKRYVKFKGQWYSKI